MNGGANLVKRRGWSFLVPLAARAATVAWAASWAFFVIAVGTSDIRSGLRGTAPIMACFLGAFSALVLAVWKWPVAGGVLMLAAGIGAWFYFPNPWAQMMLALPAALIGLLTLAGVYAGRMPR